MKEFLSVCEGECDHPYCWAKKSGGLAASPVVQSEPDPPAERVYLPHETRPVQVWADVDLGIADMVIYLNTIEGVRTQASCQGTIGEGGPNPYGPQVMCTWTPEAFPRLQAEFDVEPEGNGLWGYVHPKKDSQIHIDEMSESIPPVPSRESTLPELDELLKEAKAATPDDWWVDAEEFTEDGHYEEPRVFGRNKGEPYLLFTVAVGHNEMANANFIAKANPAAVIALVSALTAARAQVELLKEERDEAQRAKYGTPCRCESWIETCRLAEEERDKLAAQVALLQQQLAGWGELANGFKPKKVPPYAPPEKETGG